MEKMYKLLAAMLLLVLGVLPGRAQLDIVTGLTLEEYVNDILLGSGVSASNITFTGSAVQLGYMTGGENDFSVASGLVLSTDHATNPDCQENNFCIDCTGMYAEPDLLTIANSVPPLIGQNFTVQDINDVCILEFDFVATGDTVRFNYVFASDEYLTFVNTTYNDVFAFFLSGPGITGPYASPAGFPGGAVNIASVPGSNPSLPITISSVNPNTNAQYYINNPGGTDPCINGYTVPFTAEWPVECGETYHIKLAIADGTDGALESIVVLEEGSFTSNAVVEVDLTIDVGGPEENTLYEGCGTAQLTFTRPLETILGVEEMVIINYAGSDAVNGVDFSLLPDTVFFPPNVLTVSYPLQAFLDGVNEPEELVVLEILNVAACNNAGLTTYFEFFIADDPDPIVVEAEPLLLCPGGTGTVVPTVTGGYGHYTYLWCDGSTGTSLEVTPPGSSQCLLIVGDTCGYPVTEFPAEIVVVPPPNATAGVDLWACGEAQLAGTILGLPPATCSDDSGTYTHCYGENATDSFTYCPDTPGDGTYMTVSFLQGTTENFFDEFYVYDGASTAAPLLAGPIYGNLAGQTFTANNPGGCLTIQVTSDFSVSCVSGALTPWEYVVGCTNAGGVNWLWSPATGLSSVTLPNPTVEVQVPTTYTLEASLAVYPFCSTTDEVVVSPSFNFTFTTTEPTCFANDGAVTVDVTPNGTAGPWQIRVYDASGAVVATALNFSGTSVLGGLAPGTYEVEVEDSFCATSEEFGLAYPNQLSITATPDTTICIDGTATLQAFPAYADANTVWHWSTGASTLSIQVGPNGPTPYTVYATYGAGCETNEVEVWVDLYDPLSMTLSASDVVCPGDSALVGVTAAFGGLPPYQYVWSAPASGGAVAAGLAEQFVFPTFTTSYCVVLTDACETPAISGCVEIGVPEPVDPAFLPDTLGGCFPVTVTWVGLADNVDQIASALWTFGDGGTSGSIGGASHTYIEDGTWTVSHTVTTVDGCVYASEAVDAITTFLPPVAEFVATPWNATLPESRIEFTAYGNFYTQLGWDFAGLGTDVLPETSFTFPTLAGTYPVTLVVQNDWGCQDSITYSVAIDDSFVLFIPNMFTPDQDGLNDAWEFWGIDVDDSDFSLQVFDRWGEVIYQRSTLEGAWVGDVKSGGHFAANGTYLYRVETRSLATGTRKVVEGFVTLAR
jgi:gliding motility-associated-like protein